MICPNCQTPNRDTAKFCDNCGFRLPIVCPNCGTVNRVEAKFCDNCGWRLGEGVGSREYGVRREGGREGGTQGGGDAGRAEAGAPPTEPGTRNPEHAISPPPWQRFIPREFAERLEAARSARAMEGERRIVTILFSDVKGSTALAESLDPEDWTGIMNRAFEHLITPIYRYEGTVARLMGDAILAFFGAPIAHEDDPQRAILAGLEIVAGVQGFREEIRRQFGLDFNVRVGINTGLVVVGAVGSDLRMEYTAMGDAINLAARMEQTAQPGTVQIAHDTYKLVAPAFDCEDLGGIEVKGKAEPVRAYRVIGRKAMPGQLRGIAGLSSPLVGRGQELAALMQVLEGALAGRGGIIGITGEAGLGKSRLVVEAKEMIFARAAGRPLTWVEARSLSYSTTMAHHLSIDVLRGLTGLSPDLADDEAQALLHRAVSDRLGQAAAEVYPFFGHLLGLKLEEEAAAAVKYMDGPALQARYVAAFKRYLQALARSGPVVIVCEDVHWADPSSVELGLQILPVAATAPVVAMLVSRVETAAPGWRLFAEMPALPGVTTLRLNLAPLSGRESAQLVGNLLGGGAGAGAMPEPVQQLILAKAEGNPFFVEEVIRMLIDRGQLARREDGWALTQDIHMLDIPDTLQGVLAARIDRLPEEARHILQIASVIGRKFYVNILAAVLEGEGGVGSRK